MKKLFLLIAIAVAAVTATQPSPVGLSSLKFGNYKISRISPKSFRSVDGTAQIVCTNKDCTFTMSNITGTVYKKGVPFVKGYATPVTVPAGQSTVSVDGNATLCDGIGLWDVLSCIAFRASDYTIDVSMTISATNGYTRQYSRTGISVGNLLHNIRGK